MTLHRELRAASGRSREPITNALHTINPATPQLISVKMADVTEVEVVVAHNERATPRVGEVFLKIDPDQSKTDIEVEAMLRAPIPTAQILWRTPPVLALAARRGPG